MELQTRQYMNTMRERSDENVIKCLNSVLEREQTLMKRYSLLGDIMDKQLIQSSFLNPVFRRAYSARRKVCKEMNPLIDISNWMPSILCGRKLKRKNDEIVYALPYQIQLEF